MKQPGARCEGGSGKRMVECWEGLSVQSLFQEAGDPPQPKGGDTVAAQWKPPEGVGTIDLRCVCQLVTAEGPWESGPSLRGDGWHTQAQGAKCQMPEGTPAK